MNPNETEDAGAGEEPEIHVRVRGVMMAVWTDAVELPTCRFRIYPFMKGMGPIPREQWKARLKATLEGLRRAYRTTSQEKLAQRFGMTSQTMIKLLHQITPKRRRGGYQPSHPRNYSHKGYYVMRNRERKDQRHDHNL
jgi:hypothetical protein